MTTLSQDELRHVSELRLRLESYAARQAALRVRTADEGRSEMEEAMEQMRKACASHDAAAFRRADRRFHEALIRLSGVPCLRESWRPLWKALAALHRDSLGDCWPDWRLLLGEHRHLAEAVFLGDPGAAEMAMHDHLEAVWYRYGELRSKPAEDDPLQRAKAYVAFRLSARIRLDEVARRVAFTSPGNLSRLFRKAHGIGFQKYVQNLRMEKAAGLLVASRLPVEAVGRRVGYRDVSRFGQHFKRYHGATPAAFRHTALGDAEARHAGPLRV